MINIDAKVSGNVEAGLDKFLGKITSSVLLSGVAAMANVIYDEVKINTSGARQGGPGNPPGKVTGNLDEAIYRVYAKDKSSDDRQVYRVSWNRSKAPHGHLLEWGTSKMAARPFIRPAADHMPQAVQAGLDRIEEKLK